MWRHKVQHAYGTDSEQVGQDIGLIVAWLLRRRSIRGSHRDSLLKVSLQKFLHFLIDTLLHGLCQSDNFQTFKIASTREGYIDLETCQRDSYPT